MYKSRMYKTIKIWWLVVTVLLCPIITTNVFATTEGYSTINAFENQQEALQAYQLLWDSFDKDAYTGEPIYPDDYGGEYIENGILYLWVVDPSALRTLEYLNICGNSNAVRIIPSDYSLKDFEEVEEAVKEFAGQYDIQCFGVDRKDNTYRLEVTAENYNRLYTALETTLAHTVATNSILSNTARISFNQALQDSKIKIEIGEEIISTASVVYGGDGITVGPTSSCVGLSVCIGGTYGGDSALLTAGHGYTGLWNKTVRLNGTAIGNVTYMNYSQDSSSYSLGEYGIIKLNSSATTTSKVRNGNSTVTISGYYSSLPVGTNIMKYGASYGYATGSVLLVNQSTSHNGSTIGSGGGYYVSGLTVSSVRNSSSTAPIGPGDSGGPIYIYYNSQYQIHGNIVCGQVVSSSSLTAYNVYSSPIYYAIYAGFSPKYG